MTQNRPAWVELDRSALQHNLAQVRERIASANIMAVIKADGYGHGMEFVAKTLAAAKTPVSEFAVASLDDVIRLRQEGIQHSITVLSSDYRAEEFAQLAELNANPVIFSWSQLDRLKQVDVTLGHVWVKVDTGMGRLGFLPDELSSVIRQIENIDAIQSYSLMTHLANADVDTHALNQQQITQFNALAESAAFEGLSLLNSAGVVHFPEHALDVVRPGIMLYGISPVVDANAEQLNLRPVMTFKSRVLSVKSLPAGHAVGYGSTYQCSEPTRVAVIACGYGDGYPRHAPTGTPVLAGGMLTELLGRVSMDMLTINVTGLDIKEGDEVTLWGEGLPAEVVAEHAGTIAYELLCGITNRVERIFV